MRRHQQVEIDSLQLARPVHGRVSGKHFFFNLTKFNPQVNA